VVDLRPTQPTFLEHATTELTAENRKSLFVPPGVALGYQTLEDRTEILYHMDEYYDPDAAGGFRWNDPAFRISWPEAERIILERDNEYPDFDAALVSGFAGYP
jgi:dTDP-4-dehydrorhamnose 3,5-epimerase